MKKLVRLWKRPCKNGQEFKYVLIWQDQKCKERWQALSHADGRKAERQRTQKERELRMNLVEPESMKLSEFLQDYLNRTRGQVRESTLADYEVAMKHFIEYVGNMDYQKVKHEHGEQFLQTCLDHGNSPATAAKKLRGLKRIFQLAVIRGLLETNPLQYVKQPKVVKQPIRIFNDEECVSMIDATEDIGEPFHWRLFILTALCTGMRRGEL